MKSERLEVSKVGPRALCGIKVFLWILGSNLKNGMLYFLVELGTELESRAFTNQALAHAGVIF